MKVHVVSKNSSRNMMSLSYNRNIGAIKIWNLEFKLCQRGQLVRLY